MPQSDPRALLQLFADGAIPRHELRARLVIAAVAVAPERLAAEIPPDLLDEIRRDAADPPAVADDVRVFRPACSVSELGWERHWRGLSHRWHAGIMIWRRFFFP